MQDVPAIYIIFRNGMMPTSAINANRHAGMIAWSILKKSALAGGGALIAIRLSTSQ
jgi:hypothetical protein